MEIETEKIIELLFPDGVHDTWKEDPEFYQYLSKIGGYNVDGLTKEPDHLIDKKNAIQQRIQQLVFFNYKTFIHTAEHSKKIFEEFNRTEKKLNVVIETIPQFINKCESFCNKSKDISTHKKLNMLTLNKNVELLEILELPYLMELCLKTNQYNEAIELTQYARHLGSKYKNIPIICNIVNNVESRWLLMVEHVVNCLKSDLPLPKCLYLIGLLRSMNAFTEPELCVKFIQARDSWLQVLLESIPNNNANIHLTKTIELSRIHLFNIITQYKAIFNDDEHTDLGHDNIINDSAIFNQWLEERVSKFLSTLEQDLPAVTSIDSILGQCIYFGLSFGRVGADFSGRMSDIFITVISNTVSENISLITRKFEIDIDQFHFAKKALKSDIKTDSFVNLESPPEQLAEYYPLAEYCNGLIEIFNEIRLNTPLAFAQSFSKIMQSSLQFVARAMFSYYRKKKKNSTPFDRESMVKFTECFNEQLIPYVQYCMQILFPPNQVAAFLGTSVSQLQKEEITYLNQPAILQPLRSLLPVKNLPINISSPEIICSKASSTITLNLNS